MQFARLAADTIVGRASNAAAGEAGDDSMAGKCCARHWSLHESVRAGRIQIATLAAHFLLCAHCMRRALCAPATEQAEAVVVVCTNCTRFET